MDWTTDERKTTTGNIPSARKAGKMLRFHIFSKEKALSSF